MSVTVDFVKNVLANKYLTNNGGTISVHSTKNDPANFHLSASGSTYNLQVYNSSSSKLLHVATSNCTQSISTSSTGSEIHTTPEDESIRIKLYVEDSNQNRYYLRINTEESNAVELVCQSHVDNVANHPLYRQELEFDLVPVITSQL